MIEHVHDINTLPFKASLKVRNIHKAYTSFQDFMDERRPRGLRVRHAQDYPTSTVTLETRSSLAMDTAIRFFRNGGFIKYLRKSY